MGWMQSKKQGPASGGRIARLLAVVAVALAGVAISLPASAQVRNTKHNLGSTVPLAGTRTNSFDGTNEICVFCHTPHGADTSASVPLWNRVLVGGSYTTYDSLGTSSLQGKVVAVGSVSIACLSCHDGTQAMNTVINAPGSGNFSSTPGFTIAGTWTGANQTAGKMTGVANLGVDLRNDHPIGIQYAGGGITQATASLSTATFADPDFVAATKIGTSTTTVPVWYIETSGGANGRQKTDMALYSRAASGGTASGVDAQPFVECASCHDPHTTNATFLRLSNAGSAVCLACHVK